MDPRVAVLLVGVLGQGARKDPLLKQLLGPDLEQLDLDERVVELLLADPGQGLARFFVAALLDQPARREGHEPDTAGQQDRGDALDDGREAPCHVGLGCVVSADVVAAVADPEGEEDAKDGGLVFEVCG